jgi:glycosyltransferase involved in cell wall biosynthesis
MKTVCILVQNIYDFDPRVRRKAEALVAAGYSVDVLALAPVHRKKTYTLNGVNVYTISLGKKRSSLARYIFEYAAFFLWAFARVLWLMRRRRYAIIDVNTLPDFLIFAAVPSKWIGAKLILDMHEITPEFYVSKYGITRNSLLVRLLQYLEKISFDCADHVITINEPIQDLLIQRGLPRSKSIVVMNSVDEGRFVSSLPPQAADRSAEPFVIMYHGTLTPAYGLAIAIEAFSKAHAEMPEAELWILGSGPEQGVLAELVREYGLSSKVKLVGQIPPANIPEWLNKCAVGVLPIRRDLFLDFAFPNKLPEFIIMGKAVLVSRLKAIRHYFSEDALAYFEPNDPEDLARQMVRLYKDQALHARLAAKAKEEYQPICWEVMRQRYIKLIEDLAGSAPLITERVHVSVTEEYAHGK